MYKDLRSFNVWCQKVLPLVYDDSLSYYEVLCKVVDYINDLIENDKSINKELGDLKEELKVVQKWIDNFDTTYIEKVVKEFLATMIFVEITDSGRFVYYIPENWRDIKFQTTGVDTHIDGVDYGRLVLNY